MNTNYGKIAKVSIALASATAMLLVSGCGSSAAGGNDDSSSSSPVKLTFSGWVPHIEDAVDLWNEENPDIQVEFKRIANDAMKNYSSQIEAGVASDILQVSGDALVDLVIEQQVQDISKYVNDKSSLFTESDWQSGVFGDGVYGVPQDSCPTALMYRKDIFEQYGVSVPKTWDEYLDAARKLHSANPDVYITAFTPNEASLFIQDFYQEGGTLYDVDGDTWKVMLDSGASQTVADRYQTLIDEGLVKIVDMWTPDFWSAVNDGTIASFNYQAWFPVLIEENAPDLSGKWAVTQSPSDSGNGPSSNVGGGLNTIPVTSKHPEEASEFITWLNSDEKALDILIEKGGLFPAAKAGLENETLNKTSDYWGGQAPGAEFVKAAKNAVKGSTGPQVDAGFTALKDGFAKVANKQDTMGNVVTKAADAMRKAASDKGLSVK
ncbi:extracellular solute-binding protein [Bifidobacterium amazonense]|uniref:Extracellular solute-binding protein n=1 Tax=Bifidobacterium amazonense TaxID=2809027 RepID=A0ABS9VWU3_9BIFI|nr:extracellular solute-binding protein [Bifidobacterium amazonense]MCH9276538.1 extracellular solute-binding protein [Bifidobacterium amazonense]